MKKGGKKKVALKTLPSFVFQYLKTVRKLYLGILAGLSLLVVVLFVVLATTTSSKLSLDSVVPGFMVARHPLTGDVLTEDLDVLPHVFGVMVENAADAWPLVGVDQAFLVIEAPVEANIPRFITFFYEGQEVSKLGPVRSARPYYVDWNDALQGIYGHVGGSPEALEKIRSGSTMDLNQFFESEYYYRNTATRYAPHNVYTDSDLLAGALEEINPDDPTYRYYGFDVGEVSREPVSFDIDFADGRTYDVGWRYDGDQNLYRRLQSGDEMRMEDGGFVEVRNVFVVETDVSVVDAEGRKAIETLGEGRAFAARNGFLTSVTWKRSEGDLIRFYDDQGQELTIEPGRTWITVVDDLDRVSPLVSETQE